MAQNWLGTVDFGPKRPRMSRKRAFFGRVVGSDDAFKGAGQVVPDCVEDDFVRDCSALVALHPDEATEMVVDVAVRRETSDFAWFSIDV